MKLFITQLATWGYASRELLQPSNAQKQPRKSTLFVPAARIPSKTKLADQEKPDAGAKHGVFARAQHLRSIPIQTGDVNRCATRHKPRCRC